MSPHISLNVSRVKKKPSNRPSIPQQIPQDPNPGPYGYAPLNGNQCDSYFTIGGSTEI